jgi:hypothetical protein
MNWVVMDTQFMVKVLNSLMPEYGTQVKLLEKRVDKAGAEALTLEEIQEDLSLEYEHFQRARQSNIDKEESGGETALYAGGQFKGKCQGCGKYGHKVANCPDKKEKDGSRIPMEIKQENLKGSVLSAMNLVTRHQIALIKEKIMRVVDMKIQQKLPWQRWMLAIIATFLVIIAGRSLTGLEGILAKTEPISAKSALVGIT